MLSVVTNINEVIAAELAKLSAFDAIGICKEQAIKTVDMFKKRIHQEGKASDGSQIGTYSPGYMKVRTGNYGNAKKRKEPDAGFYTKGRKAIFDIKTRKAIRYKDKDTSSERPKYNRTSDTKVILSLTKQMETQLTVIPIPNGYGVGWHDSQNFQKAGWAEEKYKKKIFSLTTEEHAKVIGMAEQAISEALK